MSSNDNPWIFVKIKLPEFRQKVQLFNEWYVPLYGIRVPFIVPTKNKYTKNMEYWCWNIEDHNSIEVLLLNEISHWRPLRSFSDSIIGQKPPTGEY